MSTVLTRDPNDVANPGCAATTLARAVEVDPTLLAPGGGSLLVYGWASAALWAHPELHTPWARTQDTAVRRALMRSPALPDEAAELVVETRRSGMHTLGANPVAAEDLLEGNPSARRRREALVDLLPDGPDSIAKDPNRPELFDARSATVDLLVADAPSLSPGCAVVLAGRAQPPADPWVLAMLIERFGSDVFTIARAGASAERWRAVLALSARASDLHTRRGG